VNKLVVVVHYFKNGGSIYGISSKYYEKVKINRNSARHLKKLVDAGKLDWVLGLAVSIVENCVLSTAKNVYGGVIIDKPNLIVILEKLDKKLKENINRIRNGITQLNLYNVQINQDTVTHHLI
jgi:hypothetical protein